jgi:hypothetical protein
MNSPRLGNIIGALGWVLGAFLLFYILSSGVSAVNNAGESLRVSADTYCRSKGMRSVDYGQGCMNLEGQYLKISRMKELERIILEADLYRGKSYDNR